jgi:hypothetical protein
MLFRNIYTSIITIRKIICDIINKIIILFNQHLLLHRFALFHREYIYHNVLFEIFLDVCIYLNKKICN